MATTSGAAAPIPIPPRQWLTLQGVGKEELPYERAKTPAVAIATIANKQGAKFLAGGTNLPELMKLEIETLTHFVDVAGLKT